MYTCRPAEQKDFATIAAFPQSEQELFFMSPSASYPLTAEQLEAIAKKRLCPTVVTDGQEVVGYANFYGYEEGKRCSLGNVIIAPGHRGRGAARSLIEHMVESARDILRVPRLALTCHHTNPRALLFYKRLEFVPYDLSRMSNPQGETIVCIQMERRF